MASRSAAAAPARRAARAGSPSPVAERHGLDRPVAGLPREREALLGRGLRPLRLALRQEQPAELRERHRRAPHVTEAAVEREGLLEASDGVAVVALAERRVAVGVE